MMDKVIEIFKDLKRKFEKIFERMDQNIEIVDRFFDKISESLAEMRFFKRMDIFWDDIGDSLFVIDEKVVNYLNKKEDEFIDIIAIIVEYLQSEEFEAGIRMLFLNISSDFDMLLSLIIVIDSFPLFHYSYLNICILIFFFFFFYDKVVFSKQPSWLLTRIKDKDSFFSYFEFGKLKERFVEEKRFVDYNTEKDIAFCCFYRLGRVRLILNPEEIVNDILRVNSREELSAVLKKHSLENTSLKYEELLRLLKKAIVRKNFLEKNGLRDNNVYIIGGKHTIVEVPVNSKMFKFYKFPRLTKFIKFEYNKIKRNAFREKINLNGEPFIENSVFIEGCYYIKGMKIVHNRHTGEPLIDGPSTVTGEYKFIKGIMKKIDKYNEMLKRDKIRNEKRKGSMNYRIAEKKYLESAYYKESQVEVVIKQEFEEAVKAAEKEKRETEYLNGSYNFLIDFSSYASFDLNLTEKFGVKELMEYSDFNGEDYVPEVFIFDEKLIRFLKLLVLMREEVRLHKFRPKFNYYNDVFETYKVPFFYLKNVCFFFFLSQFFNYFFLYYFYNDIMIQNFLPGYFPGIFHFFNFFMDPMIFFFVYFLFKLQGFILKFRAQYKDLKCNFCLFLFIFINRVIFFFFFLLYRFIGFDYIEFKVLLCGIIVFYCLIFTYFFLFYLFFFYDVKEVHEWYRFEAEKDKFFFE